MDPTKTATKTKQPSTKRTSANGTPKGFTDEEKAAMREQHGPWTNG